MDRQSQREISIDFGSHEAGKLVSDIAIFISARVDRHAVDGTLARDEYVDCDRRQERWWALNGQMTDGREAEPDILASEVRRVA